MAMTTLTLPLLWAAAVTAACHAASCMADAGDVPPPPLSLAYHEKEMVKQLLKGKTLKRVCTGASCPCK